MMLKNLPSPAILAHRGASLQAPENTLAAFELAHQQGADVIELDVMLSADEVPVVIHDPSVDRTTNGKGLVCDLPLAALQELDAGEGQRISTLDEVFDILGRQLPFNIELKNYTTRDDQIVDKVAEVVKKHNIAESIIFSSFLPKNLKRVAQLLPQSPRGLLAQDNFVGWIIRTFVFRMGDYQALNPAMKNISKKKVESIHRIGRQVYPWILNDADDIRRAADWGVDGIITDDPELAVKVLRGS